MQSVHLRCILHSIPTQQLHLLNWIRSCEPCGQEKNSNAITTRTTITPTKAERKVGEQQTWPEWATRLDGSCMPSAHKPSFAAVVAATTISRLVLYNLKSCRRRRGVKEAEITLRESCNLKQKRPAPLALALITLFGFYFEYNRGICSLICSWFYVEMTVTIRSGWSVTY